MSEYITIEDRDEEGLKTVSYQFVVSFPRIRLSAVYATERQSRHRKWTTSYRWRSNHHGDGARPIIPSWVQKAALENATGQLTVELVW
jgi:hypothetical protein